MRFRMPFTEEKDNKTEDSNNTALPPESNPDSHVEISQKEEERSVENLPVTIEDPAVFRQRQDSLEHLIKLQNRIIDEFNLSNLDKVSPQRIRQQITLIVTDYARKENLVLNQKEVDQLVDEILDEMNG